MVGLQAHSALSRSISGQGGCQVAYPRTRTAPHCSAVPEVREQLHIESSLPNLAQERAVMDLPVVRKKTKHLLEVMHQLPMLPKLCAHNFWQDILCHR